MQILFMKKINKYDFYQQSSINEEIAIERNKSQQIGQDVGRETGVISMWSFTDAVPR